MIKLFKKDGKASIISHLWNIHYKLSIFEVDYMVVLCLAQNLTLWKFRKKIWLLFWLIWEKFGGFLKKNLATLVMGIKSNCIIIYFNITAFSIYFSLQVFVCVHILIIKRVLSTEGTNKVLGCIYSLNCTTWQNLGKNRSNLTYFRAHLPFHLSPHYTLYYFSIMTRATLGSPS
jgi:hypothetical protein